MAFNGTRNFTDPTGRTRNRSICVVPWDPCSSVSHTTPRISSSSPGRICHTCELVCFVESCKNSGPARNIFARDR